MYQEESGKYTYVRKKELNLDSNPYKYQITKFDLNELIVWQNLASLLDVHCHHIVCNRTDIDEEFFFGWKFNESDEGWKFEDVKIAINSDKKNLCNI